ncbi:hypothetical protein ACFXS9_29235 [Bradyrhizobium sp. RDI18]
MPADARLRKYRREMLGASTLIAVGLIISALSLTEIVARDSQHVAQATPPTQSTPDAETKPPAPPAPSEPGTTGQRPSDIPPQPARPDPDAQKSGAQPALPPAPAEKTAPPIREKEK